MQDAWLIGFDAPSLHAMYLNEAMRAAAITGQAGFPWGTCNGTIGKLANSFLVVHKPHRNLTVFLDVVDCQRRLSP